MPLRRWARCRAGPGDEPHDGHSIRGPAAVAGARPVVLLRYRPGVASETARIVHLVPLLSKGQDNAAGVALCGALLRPNLVETVTPGHGAPCLLCLISQASASTLPAPVDTLAAAATSRRHQACWRQRSVTAGGAGQ